MHNARENMISRQVKNLDTEYNLLTLSRKYKTQAEHLFSLVNSLMIDASLEIASDGNTDHVVFQPVRATTPLWSELCGSCEQSVMNINGATASPNKRPFTRLADQLV